MFRSRLRRMPVVLALVLSFAFAAPLAAALARSPSDATTLTDGARLDTGVTLPLAGGVLSQAIESGATAPCPGRVDGFTGPRAAFCRAPARIARTAIAPAYPPRRALRAHALVCASDEPPPA